MTKTIIIMYNNQMVDLRQFNKIAPNPIPNPRIVNYLWVNKDVFSANNDENELLCGIPLHYVDVAIQNAQRYPSTDFNLWIDRRFIQDSPTEFFLVSHLYNQDVTNIKVRDLNEIPSYKNDSYFAPESNMPVWNRADLARLLICEHILNEHRDSIAVYSDFDVNDIGIDTKKFNESLDKFGFIIGATKHVNLFCLENGYFAFRNTPNSLSLLSSLIENGSSNRQHNDQDDRNSIFYSYRDTIVRHSESYNILPITQCLINTLEPCTYQIPINSDYNGISNPKL